MAYEGYIIKVGDTDISKYILTKSFGITPEQRIDVDSGRDGTGTMDRDVLPHKPSKWEFEIVKLDDREMAEFLQILERNYIVEDERKLVITAYDPKLWGYRTANVFIPDYTIKLLSNTATSLTFDQFTLKFVEY